MKLPFHIETTSTRVDFYSTDCLPYKSTGAMNAERAALRHAIKQMTPIAGHGLTATLTSLNHGGADVENVLIYNVDAGSFKHLSLEGLAFQHKPTQPELHASFNYHHRYEILPLTPLAIEPHFSFGLRRLNTTVKPHEFWWSACRAARTNIPPILKDYRLQIEITGPVKSQGLSGITKTLVDGIVSALHFIPSRPEELVVSRLANTLGVSPQEVSEALTNDQGRALGPRPRLLRPTSQFVAWNPADGCCVECDMRWKPSKSDQIRVAVRIEPIF